MKFVTFSCALLVLVAVAHTQDFEGFENFDTSNFDSGNFGGQDLGGFESGGFDGFSEVGGDFNFDQFGGADEGQFVGQFQKK